MNALDEIRTMIQDHPSLSEEYLDEFISLLKNASEEELDKLLRRFKEDSVYLKIIYNNYVSKKQALEDGSEEALQAVLEEEYRILKMLESNDGKTDIDIG